MKKSTTPALRSVTMRMPISPFPVVTIQRLAVESHALCESHRPAREIHRIGKEIHDLVRCGMDRDRLRVGLHERSSFRGWVSRLVFGRIERAAVTGPRLLAMPFPRRQAADGPYPEKALPPASGERAGSSGRECVTWQTLGVWAFAPALARPARPESIGTGAGDGDDDAASLVHRERSLAARPGSGAATWAGLGFAAAVAQ